MGSSSLVDLLNLRRPGPVTKTLPIALLLGHSAVLLALLQIWDELDGALDPLGWAAVAVAIGMPISAWALVVTERWATDPAYQLAVALMMDFAEAALAVAAFALLSHLWSIALYVASATFILTAVGLALLGHQAHRTVDASDHPDSEHGEE